MPRLARLDAPGVLHHVMGRGIERREIFQNDTDRQDFVDRLNQLAIKGALDVYAWTLMPNHSICWAKLATSLFHLNLLRSGLVKNLNELNQNRWSGHSVIVGKVKRDWQDTQYVISWIGVRALGYTGAEIAIYLGVTNSCVTLIVSSDSKPEIGNLLDSLSTSSTNVP